MKTFFIFLILVCFYISCQKSKESNLTLLGGQIPTDTPLIFGENIISTGSYEFGMTFNPEMDELYFTRRKPNEENTIYNMKLINGTWTAPQLASFATNKGWDFEPHITPNGNFLYFGSTRPLNDTIESSGLHEWYLEKTSNGWSKPTPLGKPFLDKFIMYMSSSETGNLYFTSAEEGAKPEDGGIYSASRENNEYTSIKKMEKEINFPGKWIAHPYIAPDESFIIYDCERLSGFGDCDLYISFNKNGTWTEPYNLGSEINTEQCEMCSSVSPDGKYLFFHRGVYTGDENDIGNIYWVDFIRIKERIESMLSN